MCGGRRQGECGRQKPHSSLSRADGRAPPPANLRPRKRRDPAGNGASWAVLPLRSPCC